MLNDGYKLIGHFQLFKNGQLVVDKKNLIVTNGKTQSVQRLFGLTANPVSAIAVGADGTAAALAQTGLIAEITRKAFDTAPGLTGQTISVITTFPAGTGTGTWQEAALLDTAAVGAALMFSRVTFTAVPKGAGDEFSIRWTVTCA